MMLIKHVMKLVRTKGSDILDLVYFNFTLKRWAQKLQNQYIVWSQVHNTNSPKFYSNYRHYAYWYYAGHCPRLCCKIFYCTSIPEIHNMWESAGGANMQYAGNKEQWLFCCLVHLSQGLYGKLKPTPPYEAVTRVYDDRCTGYTCYFLWKPELKNFVRNTFYISLC